MTTFVIGCTHFGHANIIALAERPFSDVGEMNKAMIARWNAAVSKSDTVIHMGDFAWRTSPYVDFLNQLNGKIEFMNGNHDPNGWGTAYRTLRYQKRKFILCHYPILEWDGFFRGAIHIHAHTHKTRLIDKQVCHDLERNRYNVSAEAVNYTPISLDKIIDLDHGI